MPPRDGLTSQPDTYRPSPRPTYTGGVAIPQAQVARHVWGDPESGEILDWIYVSSDKIHQLLFEIPAGGQFTHSAAHRTFFGADEVLYVVAGTVAFANPATGEVARAEAGEALFFGPGTWHHAFNWSAAPARVLELFAPPPSAGTSGAYARQHPLLTSSRYAGDGVLGQHIPGAGPAPGPRSLTVVRPGDYRWRLDGDRNPVLTGVMASTPQLTVARCEVRAAGWSGWLAQAGDASGYLLSGRLRLRLSPGPDTDPVPARGWDELGPGDGFYVPVGWQYQVSGATADGASYLLGWAPTGGA